MKELEKTKRISIAAVLFILVIIIGLLAYKRPKHIYTENTANTLKTITTKNYLISLSEIDNKNSVIVDIRSQFEFNKGHLNDALNIYTPEILNDNNSEIFKKIKEENKTIILYGTNPNEVIAPFMVLYQLGFTNIKILTVENSYTQNKLISQNVTVENSNHDVNQFIAESYKKAAVKPKQKPIIKTPRKVIPFKKKKKMAVEGGC